LEFNYCLELEIWNLDFFLGGSANAENKVIVLGISGGIAAYKAADLASKLAQAGAIVKVVMTWEATQLVQPLTFQALTGNPVVTDMFEPAPLSAITHVSLADEADVIAIVPATANIIAKMAAGIADDILTCTVLATKAPIVIAPAMHNNMYINPVTRENMTKLKDRGFTVIPRCTGAWLPAPSATGGCRKSRRLWVLFSKHSVKMAI